MTKSKHDPDGSKLKALLKRDAHLKSVEITTYTEKDQDHTWQAWKDSEWDNSSYRLL